MTECIICNNCDFKPLYNNTLLSCSSCGFVTANLDIEKLTLDRLYSENYFKGEEYEDYTRDKSIIQYNFQKRISYLNKRLPKETFSNTLEIGCAYGFFGELAIKNWNGKYTGIDVVPEAISYAQKSLKLNAHCNDYLKFTNPESDYSAVFMWDVIEHLPNPQEFINKVSKEIQPGGSIFITTGDIKSLLARYQGQHWRMIHPPTHLHYFDKKTLSRLLTNNGFVVTQISYPSVARSIKQMYYSLFILNKKKVSKLHQQIYKLIPESWNISLNTRDIMFLQAKKA